MLSWVRIMAWLRVLKQIYTIIMMGREVRGVAIKKNKSDIELTGH